MERIFYMVLKYENRPLASDGLKREIEYIIAHSDVISEYEFREHYGCDFIGGRVKKIATDCVNKRIYAYYRELKQSAKKNGDCIYYLGYKKLYISDMNPFFTVKSIRIDGSDKVIMTINDMSDKHFRTVAQQMFNESMTRQQMHYRGAAVL